jgi:hypothetical protein
MSCYVQCSQIIALPDERAQLIHAGHSHVEADASSPILLPQDQIISASESRDALSDLRGKLVDLFADSIVCLGEEVFQDRTLLPVSQQILELRLGVIGLVSEEEQLQYVRHLEVGGMTDICCCVDLLVVTLELFSRGYRVCEM